MRTSLLLRCSSLEPHKKHPEYIINMTHVARRSATLRRSEHQPGPCSASTHHAVLCMSGAPLCHQDGSEPRRREPGDCCKLAKVH